MSSLVKRVLRKGIKIISGCELIYHTDWYKSMFVDFNHEIYPDNVWYREHDERNFDLVNLGSSGAKWAFDYTDFKGLKAMNWAQQPQTLLEDYELLRHFHSILKSGGYVIITIMPFTSINKQTGLYDALKYAKMGIHGEPIEPYLFEKAQRLANYPVLMGKTAFKGLIKSLLGKYKDAEKHAEAQVIDNPMSATELNADAQRWIEGWKKQFSILDLDAPLTEQNQEGRKYRISLMRKMVDFCIERGYKPIYVIPPVTEHLSKHYTEKFEYTYVYSYLKAVNRDVLTLDYSKDDAFKDDSLYFNSFFLNKKGRGLFTKRVLTDLNLIK